MAINEAQAKRAAALAMKRGDKTKAQELLSPFANQPTSSPTNNMKDLLAGGLNRDTSTNTNNSTSTNTSNNQIDWSKDAGEQIADSPLIQSSNEIVASADDVDESLNAFATDGVDPMNLQTESEIMYERDVKNMGMEAATEFMNKRNQAFAEEATKDIQRLIDGGKVNVTDEDIYAAINKTIGNHGGQIKNTPDWANTVRDIRTRMGIGTDIANYAENRNADNANAYISGTYTEGEQPETFKEKVDAYISMYGLDIDPSNIGQHIDLEAKYEEYVNTPEYQAVIKKYNAQNKNLEELQDRAKYLEEDIKNDYPGLSDSQIANIQSDRLEGINREKDTILREINQTREDANMISGLGEGRFNAYIDQEKINLENDWKTLNLTKGIAQEDWTKDWTLRQQDYNKNTQKELSQLSLLEKYDLKNATDNFIDGIDASDYVKDILRYRKEMDTNLGRKQNMTTNDDGDMIFYDDYGNVTNTVSSNGTPEVAPNFVGYEPVTDNTKFEQAYTQITSLGNGSYGGQCGSFVNNYLEDMGLDRFFKDPISQKETVINSQMPKVGSVAIINWENSPNATEEQKDYGHVGIVTSVNDDGTVTLKQSNKGGNETIFTSNYKLDQVAGYFDPRKSISTDTQTEDVINNLSNMGRNIAEGKIGLNSQNMGINDRKAFNEELSNKGFYDLGIGNSKRLALDTKDRRTDVDSLLQTIDRIEEINELMGDGEDGVDTGPFKALGQRFSGKLGIDARQDEDFIQLRALTGKELTSFIKKISGVAVSDKERIQLEKYLPTVGQSDKEFAKNYKAFVEEAENILARVLVDYGFDSLENLRSVAYGEKESIPSYTDDIQTNQTNEESDIYNQTIEELNNDAANYNPKK